MSSASTVPIPYIDEAGFHMPTLADIIAAHKADYQSVYGQDVVLDSDTQDGQWVTIEAQGFYDAFALALDVYNSFSPSGARGSRLSSLVKLNGIKRKTPTYSTCDVTIIGVAGTELDSASVADAAGNVWNFPSTVVIPLSGTVTVTAVCSVVGAVTADPGDLSVINTPTRGWQSASNAYAASPGAPVETDPQLRVRQSQSAQKPSQSLLAGLLGDILEVPGVTRVRPYVNQTNGVDSNGLPGHSLALVIDGGDASALALLIATAKGVAGTYGTTVIPVTNATGVARNVAFFRPTQPPVSWVVTLRALTGFTQDVQSAIAKSLSDWTNALGIGNSLYIKRAYAPALLVGTSYYSTFELLGVAAARDGAAPAESDVSAAFTEAFSCDPSYVSFNFVTP